MKSQWQFVRIIWNFQILMCFNNIISIGIQYFNEHFPYTGLKLQTGFRCVLFTKYQWWS